MRKIMALAFTLLTYVTYSQDLIDTMARESCDCISKRTSELKNITPQMMESEFGICVIKSYSAHADEYNKLFKADLTDKPAMKLLGEKIALKMFTYCPQMLMDMVGDDDSDDYIEDLKIEGKITDIKIEQFVTIQIKDKNNRQHNFLILDYFDSAALFTNNEIKKNDSIAVTYTEIELYDPKAKEFRYFKVIKGLEKK